MACLERPSEGRKLSTISADLRAVADAMPPYFGALMALDSADLPHAGEPCDERCACSPMDDADAYFEDLYERGVL